MATTIRINPSAFLVGGKLYGIEPRNVIIVVGDEHADPLPGAQSMTYYSDLPQPRFGWMVTADGVNMLDEEYALVISNADRYSDVKFMLAKLVQQGILIVSKAGVVQTPAQILA